MAARADDEPGTSDRIRTGGHQVDVFISYSSKDSHAAQAVCQAVEAAGFPCWIAPRDIAPGREWSEEIIDALNAARAIVLIFSQSSNDSPQVLREIERGINKRIPILVFRIEEIPLSKAMEYFLSVPHWFDAHTQPLDAHFLPLTQALSQLLGAPSTATKPSNTPQPTPRFEVSFDLPSEPTFLFTDIEGSTKLWEQYRDAMQLALAQHDSIVRNAVQQNNGQVFKTIGDAFCAVFAKATEALAAAQQAQEKLLELTVVDQPLKVRMALHTGMAERREDDFFGQTLNRVARLLAVGHGRQILLSQATRNQLPESEPLLDLGMHRLKDLQQPEHVWQITKATFPPLRSLPLYGNNLPNQASSFIGRKKECAAIHEHLQNTSLLTLTGLGGCGKTRLSLQVAAEVVEQFPDGVWLVELAPLSDPNLIPQTIAEVLSLREVPGEPLTKTLTNYLKDKRILLLLDNCEHLLEDSAKLVNALIRSGSQLKILVSSREALGITGERTYPVASLSLPEPGRDYTPENLLAYESVQLFLDRAKMAKQDFQITESNVHTCAKVCHQLDGIPLAIELAAARIRSMPIENLAARLEDRFKILTGGSRTALPRQQTLRALIDWSYDLLEENQKALLARISVFAGGCSLEAAENVCITPHPGYPLGEAREPSIEDWEVLDLLTALHDKSLLVYEQQEDKARYRLLETVRQYATDRLIECGERETVRGKHALYFLGLVEKAEYELTGPESKHWLNLLSTEYGNLRAALEWAHASAEGADVGLRLCAALYRFWHTFGLWSEGRRYIDQALERQAEDPDSHLRGRVFHSAGFLMVSQGDTESALYYLHQGRKIYQKSDDHAGMALSLNYLGVVSITRGDLPQATVYLEECLEFYRKLNNKEGTAAVLLNLGELARRRGNLEEARQHFETSLIVWQELQNKHPIAVIYNNLARIARTQERYPDALSLAHEALQIRMDLQDVQGIVLSMEVLAGIMAAQGRFEEVACLLSASDTLCQLHELTLTASDAEEHQSHQALAQAALSQEAFEQAQQRGKSLNQEQAAAYALALT